MAAKARVDPTAAFRFGVEMGGAIVGWFTECSGLTVERKTKTYQEGGVNDYVHHLPGRVKRFNITLKHGVADNSLWNWLQKGVFDGQVEHRNASVVLYDSQLKEMSRWDLPGVYPGKWSGSTLNTADNEALLESLELVQDSGGGAPQTATVQRVIAEEVAQEPSTGQEIDVSALAKKVFDLLKQDLRVERDRMGHRRY